MPNYATPKTAVLVALAHDVVRRASPFDTWADAVEALKQAAATRKVPYDSERVTEAITLVNRTRPVFRDDPRLRPPVTPPTDTNAQPYSKDEATAFLRELKWAAKSMPATTGYGAAAHERRVRAQADGMRGTCTRDRVSTIDYLKSIFGEVATHGAD